MLQQQMGCNVTATDGPGVYRRCRQGGWQNDCSENRRSGGVCVVPARDVNPGGPGPGSITLARRPTIDAARCHGPGKACSRLQAEEGSCHQAHAAARPQHRARASAARVERRPGLAGSSAVFQPIAVPARQLRPDLDVSADRRRRRPRKTRRAVQERVRAVDTAQRASLVGWIVRAFAVVDDCEDPVQDIRRRRRLLQGLAPIELRRESRGIAGRPGFDPDAHCGQVRVPEQLTPREVDTFLDFAVDDAPLPHATIAEAATH